MTKTSGLFFCQNGLALKVKKDVGVYEGFHYIDLKNIEERVVSDGRSVTNVNLKKKLLGSKFFGFHSV